ncbi:MAG TPA: ribosomal protein S18-alanine N-acetyltransferase [Thermoanaerobaculia bacterium]|nr:ribosomal protein S18-alanine N-acetyltransferase [Thermoanaerobaculia bacterium]
MSARVQLPDISIQFATARDIAAVHKLEESSFPAPWRKEFFESELYASGRFNLVARRGNVVIGYLFAMWFFDEMHVNKIAVEVAERRQGIAQALMERCIEFARSHSIKTLSLEVRKSNHGAQEFYRQLDFASSYLRPRYYPDGEAAVVMTKVL